MCCIFSEHLFLRTPLNGCFCFHLLSVLLHDLIVLTIASDHEISCTNNRHDKNFVLSDIITVVPNSILCINIQEHLLISKKFLDCLRTLSAYNNLLVHYSVYSSYSMECQCARWKFDEAYTLVMIQYHVEKISWNNKLAIPKCQYLLPKENHSDKNVTVELA